MLDRPLDSSAAYIQAFSSGPLPVLRRSLRALNALRADEDRLNGRNLATEVICDPLLALQVLTSLERHRPARQNHDITTIERALIMMGFTPFFERFGALPAVEDCLAGHPRALLGVLGVAGRSQRAALWARRFALARHDIDPDEVTVAALLHDVAELMFWCFAPVCMQRIDALRAAEPGLSRSAAQLRVLHVSIQDVQRELSQAWHVPALLAHLMVDEQADDARSRSVVLACELARHAARGWDHPKLPAEVGAVAALLHLKPAAVWQLIDAPAERIAAALAAASDSEA